MKDSGVDSGYLIWGKPVKGIKGEVAPWVIYLLWFLLIVSAVFIIWASINLWIGIYEDMGHDVTLPLPGQLAR